MTEANNMEEVTDLNLHDVFNDIKGTEGRQRAFVIFDDFKKACIKYELPCLQPQIQQSKQTGDDSELTQEIEDHFRNICESCSPVFDNVEGQGNSPKFAGGENEDMLDDLGNTDEGVTAA